MVEAIARWARYVWQVFFPPAADKRAATLLPEYENLLLDKRLALRIAQQEVKMLEAQIRVLRSYGQADNVVPLRQRRTK